MDATGAWYCELTKSYRHDKKMIKILDATMSEAKWTEPIISLVIQNNASFLEKYPLDLGKYTASGPDKHPKISKYDAEYIGTDYLRRVPDHLRHLINVLILKNDDVDVFSNRCLERVADQDRFVIKAIDTITRINSISTSEGKSQYDKYFNAGAEVVIYKTCPVRSLRALKASKGNQFIPARCLGVVQSIQGKGKDVKVTVHFWFKNEQHLVEVGMVYHNSEDPLVANVSRLQIPLETCYCMTSTSSQGLEFDVLVVDCNQYGNAWLKHSLYTAFSRGKKFENLYVLNIPKAGSNKEDKELALQIAELKLNAKDCAQMSKDQESVLLCGTVQLARSLIGLDPSSQLIKKLANKDSVDLSTLTAVSPIKPIAVEPIAGSQLLEKGSADLSLLPAISQIKPIEGEKSEDDYDLDVFKAVDAAASREYANAEKEEKRQVYDPLMYDEPMGVNIHTFMYIYIYTHIYVYIYICMYI